MTTNESYLNILFLEQSLHGENMSLHVTTHILGRIFPDIMGQESQEYSNI